MCTGWPWCPRPTAVKLGAPSQVREQLHTAALPGECWGSSGRPARGAGGSGSGPRDPRDPLWPNEGRRGGRHLLGDGGP